MLIPKYFHRIIVLFVIFAAALALPGCGVAHAGDFAGPTGTFMFKSQGHSSSGEVMFEAGFVTVSSDGRECVTSTMNTDGQVQGVTTLPANPCNYGAHPGAFDPQTRIGIGGNPIGQGEGSTSYVSPDGQTIYAVGHEASGWTWLLEAHKISN